MLVCSSRSLQSEDDSDSDVGLTEADVQLVTGMATPVKAEAPLDGNGVDHGDGGERRPPRLQSTFSPGRACSHTAHRVLTWTPSTQPYSWLGHTVTPPCAFGPSQWPPPRHRNQPDQAANIQPTWSVSLAAATPATPQSTRARQLTSTPSLRRGFTGELRSFTLRSRTSPGLLKRSPSSGSRSQASLDGSPVPESVRGVHALHRHATGEWCGS